MAATGPDADAALEGCLTKIGRDLFPSLANPEGAPQPIWWVGGVDSVSAHYFWLANNASSHPLFWKACELLDATGSFSSLLPDESGSPALLQGGLGAVGVRAETLVTGIIQSAARELLYTNGTIDPERLDVLMERNLARLRSIARRGTFEADSIVGLVNLEIRRPLRTSFGDVHPSPKVKHGGGPPYIRTTSILSVPHRLQANIFRHPAEAAPPHETFTRAEEERSRACLLLSLAVALTCGTGRSVVPIPAWHTMLYPGSSWMSYGPGAYLPKSAHVLTDEESSEVEQWAEKLDQRHSKHLNVAAERVVQALGERQAYEDQLIDAVIAWENICGGSPETTLRVTGGLVKLIEHEAENRLALRKELTKLYDVRSSVVHGDTIPAADVVKAAIAAVDIAISALRELYDKRTDLITLRSRQRAERLLLQDP